MSLKKTLSRSRLRVELLESRLQPGSLLAGGMMMDGMAADLANLESRSTTFDSLFDSLYGEAARENFLLDLAASAETYSSTPTTLAVTRLTLVQGGGFQQTTASTPLVAAATAQQTAQLVTVANANPTRIGQTGARNAVPIQAQTTAVTVTADISHQLQTSSLALTKLDTRSSGATPPTLAISSFLGGEGEDALNGVIRDSAGNIYVSGSVDNGGVLVAVVGQLDPAASTLNWAVALDNPNGGRNQFAGMALSLDESRIYVVGSADNGSGDPSAPTDGVIFQLSTADGSPTGSGVVLPQGSFTGVQVAIDDSVFVGGSTLFPEEGIRVGIGLNLESNLSLPPRFATIVGAIGSDLTTKNAQSIAVDEAGNTYYAAVFSQGGNNRSAFFSLDPAGGLNWGGQIFFFANQNPGDAGGMGGVIYSNNFVYLAGQLNTDGTDFHHDLIMTKVNAADGSAVWAWRWYVDDRQGPAFARVGDWGASAIGLVNGDHPVVTGLAVDPVQYPGAGEPPTQGADICTTHFGPGGNTTTLFNDGDPENCYGGSGTDRSIGMTISGNTITLVGATDSADMPVTAGVLQEVYGGGVSDGLLSSFDIV